MNTQCSRTHTDAGESARIPVVDLSPLGNNPVSGHAEVCREILWACENAGCFSVCGAPIQGAQISDALLAMNRFFGLADDDPVKRAVHYRNNQGEHGWTPMLEEPAYDPGTLSWVESFDCGPPSDEIAKMPTADRSAHVPSIWPAINDFHDQVRSCWSGLTATAWQLFSVLSELLEEDSGFLFRHCSRSAPNTLRLLNYPENPRPADDVNVGISAHTDFECLTLIYQSDEGLEVQDSSDNWIRVPAREGQFVVLLGDMFERWSNGRYRATRHRVTHTTWARQSIVMFFAVDGNRIVQPLPQFADSAKANTYKPITQHQHISDEIARAEKNRLAMQDYASAAGKALGR